jgi:hypothetical protein
MKDQQAKNFFPRAPFEHSLQAVNLHNPIVHHAHVAPIPHPLIAYFRRGRPNFLSATLAVGLGLVIGLAITAVVIIGTILTFGIAINMFEKQIDDVVDLASKLISEGFKQSVALINNALNKISHYTQQGIRSLVDIFKRNNPFASRSPNHLQTAVNGRPGEQFPTLAIANATNIFEQKFDKVVDLASNLVSAGAWQSATLYTNFLEKFNRQAQQGIRTLVNIFMKDNSFVANEYALPEKSSASVSSVNNRPKKSSISKMWEILRTGISQVAGSDNIRVTTPLPGQFIDLPNATLTYFSSSPSRVMTKPKTVIPPSSGNLPASATPGSSLQSR